MHARRSRCYSTVVAIHKRRPRLHGLRSSRPWEGIDAAVNDTGLANVRAEVLALAQRILVDPLPFVRILLLLVCRLVGLPRKRG